MHRAKISPSISTPVYVAVILSCCLPQVIEIWLQQMVGESLLSQQWFVIVHVNLLRRQERRATCIVLK